MPRKRAPSDQPTERLKLLGAAVAVVVVVVIAVVLLLAGNDPPPSGPAAAPPAGTDVVPESIAADCSKDVHAALSSFLNGVADGRRIS